jgi:hypothetical protein
LLRKSCLLAGSGLPDGLFSKQKSQFGEILGGHCLGRCWYILRPFGLFYGYLVYFAAIWYILWQLGILYGHLVYFSRLGMLHQEKSGNPGRYSILLPIISHHGLTENDGLGSGFFK